MKNFNAPQRRAVISFPSGATLFVRRKPAFVGSLLTGALVLLLADARAFQPPARAPLANFDQRQAGDPKSRESAEQTKAAAVLRARVAKVKVDFDSVIGSPKFVSTADGFLSGPDGEGKAISAAVVAAIGKGEPHRATKAFLKDHSQLFGHGPEVLAKATVTREFTTGHNGMKTVVWEQQVDGIPVFEGVLISHTTSKGELVNLSSQFVPSPEAAADRGTPARARAVASPVISAARAVALAATNLGELGDADRVTEIAAAAASPEKRQKFSAPFLRGESEAKLTWVPMNKETLRLCWDLILTGRDRPEMYRMLVDAQTGEVVIRRCLTDYLTNATYRVYTSDSPSPFSPGHPTPLTNQPVVLARTLVTFPALNTNASLNGWMDDLVNETRGNNVDAHTDTNNDNSPDLPRPVGSPFRVFDFPMNLATDDPIAYRSAAVVQLFYVCNWMHDKLYELGFTEAAGNFQNNNFGRGGLGNDALNADAQDGGGTDNANMSTPPDGLPPRMQMYVFSGPTPRRDGDFDIEIVLHEYTHGLSNRRVGGGVGISALQSSGMGEGWSDWYALTLLSESGDNVNGNYAAGGYATYKFGSPTYLQNYYFGIRRYPYSTDMTKNPLTFKDIDPGQASSHPGVPINPIFGGGNAAEVHNQGEVWCVTLWEARANLIAKHGFTIGNQLILQLVTDGMNLCPADPNFLQARDGIIQADLVNTGGANRNELWAAFAKRGMGATATSPSSSTTSGVHESFDLPDDLSIVPSVGFIANGPVGGPFSPNSTTFTLTNTGAAALTWTMANTSTWLNVSPAGGVLTPGGPVATVTATLDASATTLPMGIYFATVRFTNLTSGVGAGRQFMLRVGQPDYFTEIFEAADNDLAFSTFTFTPNGSTSFYAACREVATNFPTDPTGGTFLTLDDDDFEQITLAGTNTVGIYNRRRNALYIGSNGYLTMDSGDTEYVESALDHFNLARISALYDDLDPSDSGTISWKQLSNRVAVTFQGVPQYGGGGPNSFQLECFFDGRIRITYLEIAARDGLAGLSEGLNVPIGFVETDLSALNPCVLPLLVTVPTNSTEAAGVLVGQGHVILPTPFLTNFIVNLASSDTNEVTVPPSITFAAGQTNGAFDLTIRNDAELDGTQIAVISASAAGLGNGMASIAVHDDESTTLQVVVLGSPVEGGGVRPGIVRVSSAVGANVTVGLNSSDITELQVPTSVVISNGNISASFPMTPVDDARIDGPQTVTVTAHVPNWTNGSRLVTVLDNETLNLAVTLPSAAIEFLGILTNAGAVQLSGTLPTNLTVSLLSSDLSEATVPASATVLAGQLAGAFSITLVDDLLIDGGQSVTVTASAAGWTNGFATMTVLDDESPPVPFNPNPPDLASNVSANIALSWDNGRSGVTNEVYFDTAPVPSALLGTTTNNTWDLPLLAPNTTYYWKIVANKIGSTPGPIWRFTTRGVDRLEFSAVPSPQSINQPFPVTVTARDELNRAVSNYLGPVTLSGFVGSGVISNSILPSPVHTSSSSGNWTLGYSFTPNTNMTVTAVRHYFGTKVSIWTDAGVLLAAQPVSSILGTWLETVLTTPIQLTGGTRYRVGAFTSGGDYYWRTDPQPTFPNGTVDQGYEITGDNFPTSSDGERWFVDLRYTIGSLVPVPITPTNSGSFTDGVWAGNVTVSSFATNMILSAKDAADHSGQSNPFHVVPSNQPPVFITQPLSQQVITGATVNLSVSVFGAAPVSYQWRYNGGDLANATNANLVLSDVVTNQSGNYNVVVINPFGTVTSLVAVVAILALPPFFDDFEPGIDLPQWSGFSSTVRATNFGGSISGVNSLWFGGNDDPRFAISRPINTALGGVVDFYLHIADDGDEPWEGADLPEEGIVLESSTNGGGSWTELGRYDTAVYFSWTRVLAEIPPAAQAPQTQFRWRQLSNSGSCCDHWALDDVSVATGPRPPSILAQPVNRVTVMGGSATFTASAGGSTPLSYQWRKGGTNILNATNTSHIISGAQAADVGNYSVVVTNLYGSITSAGATLTLVDAGGVVAYFTDGSSAQTGPAGPITAAGFVPLHVTDISTYNLNDAGILFIDEVDNGQLTSELQARLPQIQTWVGNGGKLIIHDRATGLLTPNPFLLGFPGITSTRLETSDIDVIPPGNTVVTAGPFGVVNNATLDGGDSSAHGYITANQLPAGSVPILNTAGSIDDVVSFSYPLGQGFIYYSSIPLDCYLEGGDCGDHPINPPLRNIYTPNVLIYMASLNNCSNCPPTIEVQPANQTAVVGGAATFTVLAGGTAPLSYQWRFNGTNITGATNSGYTIASVQSNMASHYSVAITNFFGSTNSLNATLTVLPVTAVVAVFDDPIYVDTTSGGVEAESDNVQASVQSLGFPAISFTNIVEAAGLYRKIIIPEQENRELGPDLLPAARSALSNFVFQGGKLIVQGNLSGHGATLLNAVFNFGIQEVSAVGGVSTRTAEVVATEFADDPATIPILSATTALLRGSLPVGALNIYTNVTGSQVVLIEYGNGLIVFTGWDWYDAVPIGAQNGGWLTVLQSALLQGPLPARPPLIVSQPANRAATVARNASFSVGTVGTFPLSYQWRKGGTNLSGATNSTYTIANVQMNNAGVYSVLVSNAIGFALSSNAVLTVSTSSVVGTILVFSDNNGGSTPFQTALTNLDLDHQYFNSGQEISFNLAVASANADDTLAIVDSSTGNHTFDTLPAFIAAGGRAILSYWDLDLLPSVASAFQASVVQDFFTTRPVYDWGGSPIFDGIFSPLTFIDSVNDDGDLLQPIGGAYAAAGFSVAPAAGMAAIVVGNSDRTILNGFLPGEAGSISEITRFAENEILMLSGPGTNPPSFTTHPVGRAVRAGTNVSFIVSVSGSAPMFYQWRRNGTNLVDGGRVSGASGFALTISSCVESDSGSYSLFVSNAFGTATSSNAVLLVSALDHFSWSSIASPQSVAAPFPVTITARDEFGSVVSNYTGTVALSGSMGGGLATNTIIGNMVHTTVEPGTWTLGYAFRPNTNITVTHMRSTSGTKMSIWTDAGALVVSQNVSGVPGVWTETPLASPVLLAAGTTYRVGYYTADQDHYYHTNAPASFPHGTLVHGYYYFSGDGFPNTFFNENNVIFLCDLRYTVGTTAPVAITPTNTANFSNGVWNGNVTVLQRATNMMLIAADGLGHNGTSTNFDVSCSNCPPSIVSQSPSLTVRPGTNVSFSVVVSGTVPLTYQWRLNGTNLIDGGRISGATSLVLNIANSLESDSGLYSLLVSNAFGTTTSSNAVLLVSALDHFTWSAIPSPQLTQVPFAVSIQARDVTNGLVTNYSGSAALSGRAGGPATNTIVNPGFELGLSAWLRSQAGFYSNTPSSSLSGGMPTQGVNYWRFSTLDFAPMQATNFARISQVVNMTGMGTLMFDASLFAPGGWLSRINGEVRIDGVTKWTQTAAGIYTNQSIDVSAFSGPHTLELRSQVLVPGAGGSQWVMFDNLRSTAGGLIAVLPANTGNFSNGVWNGNVTVLQPATNMVLIAEDGLGHSGTSTNFNVLLANDVSVTISDAPDPVVVGASLTNIITVRNAGPTAATGINATNLLPPSVSFVSATTSQGSCSLVGGRVECTLGSLADGGVATITVVTTPGAGGQITNRVGIGRAEADSDLANNSAASVTLVLMPLLTVTDVSVVEGNSGSFPPAVFNVRLTPPSHTNVSVNFATANGSAVAGSDYVSTNGVLVFAPGETNRTLTVYVRGDAIGEPTETFFLNLSGPVNAGFGDAQGVGSIFNDDAPPDVYLRSTTGIPWGSSANEAAMNRAFGINNWQDLRFETVNPGALFSPATRFIFMEGSDSIANELQAFLGANTAAIENWVAAGGRLFLNSAPNEGAGMSFGFGVTLVYSDPTDTAMAVDALHPIFAGPFTPVGSTWTGSSFGHATVNGVNLTALIANSFNGRLVLAQKRHGAGLALFGGMTTDNFHNPQPNASNLRANILAYVANFISCSNCPPSIVSQSPGGTVRPSTNVSFSVTVSGTPPFTYQWRRDGTNLLDGGRISGATSLTLDIVNCLESDSGLYSLLVSNAFGTATSSIIALVVSALDHFTWSVVPSPQLVNSPFAVTIEARDFSNRVVTNFTGPVALSGLINAGSSNSILSSPVHDNSASGSFTVGYAFTPSSNIMMTAVRHYFGTKVSIWTDAGVLIVAQPVSSVLGTWLETPLTNPVQLIAGTRYRIGCFTGGGTYHWRMDGPGTFPHGTIDQTFNSSGDAFPISGDAARWWFVDLRYNVGTSIPVPISPANSGNFTAGVWSGNVTVLARATNMVLLVDNGAGRTGLSNPFNAVGSNQPPIIVAQPVGSQVVTGATVNLSVSVFGTPAIHYQWRFSGSDLLNETNASLVLANVVTNQSGSYSVFVTNLFGTATSANAVLTVVPGSSAVAIFDNSTYVDTTSGGVGAESDNLQASVRSFGFATTNVTDLVAAAGAYQRIIVPEQEIRPLALDLLPSARAALSNYVFNGGKLIVHGTSSGAGGTLLNAIFGFAIQEVSSGGNSQTRGVDAIGTEFGDDPATIPDNSATTVLSRQSVPLNAANIYTNLAGSGVVMIQHGAGTIVFIGWDWYNAAPIGIQNSGWLTVLQSALQQGPLVPGPAAITSQPANQAVGIGATANFSVSVSGTPPFSYQWRRDGVNLVNGGRISGATGPFLTIVNSLESDSGLYSVTVSNAFGGAASSNATLAVGLLDHFTWTVFPSTQATLVRIEARDISNRVVGNFQGPVTLSASAGGGVSNTILSATSHTFSASGNFTLGYSFTPRSNMTVIAVRHYFGTKVSIWTDAGVLLATQTVTSVPGTWVETPLATPVQLTAGLRYRVATYNPSGNYYYRNDLGTNFPFGTLNQSHDLAGDAFPTLTDSVRWWLVDLRYVVIAGAGNPVAVSPTTSGPFVAGAWTGMMWASQVISNAVLRASDGLGHSGESPPITLYTQGPVTFAVQPQSQNILPGANVTLTVLAVGTAPVRYQWQFEGTNILNATNASYSFTNASITNIGNYSVVATDGTSTATSSNAYIFVIVSPGFVQQPQPQTVLQGQSATFSVVVTGAPPIFYRWIRGGIPYATSSVPMMVFTNNQISTVIRVSVTNLATGPLGITSALISLTVLPDNDRDGMADLWETQYGFNTNNAADATLDFDGDNMINRDEYVANTVPTDPLSLLKLTLTATNIGVLQFVAQTNIGYTLQYRTNLNIPSWVTLTNITAQPSQVRTVLVNAPNPPPESIRFYRLVTPLVP